MAAFDLEADTTFPLDFALMLNRGLALFRRNEVLTEAAQELTRLGYELKRLDASDWDEDALHVAFARELEFPDYYGRNVNALDDCLYDVAHGDYGWSTSSTGLAVTVAGFGAFATRDHDLAATTANVMARASHTGLLFGHRLVWLLQVDDGSFRLGSVGCFDVQWNGREWLNSDRA